MTYFNLLAVSLAAALYALFSSPTPDMPGIAEYAIAGLLALVALRSGFARTQWSVPLGILLLYGLTVPLFTGMMHGHGGEDMMRDVTAFLVLAVPLCLAQTYAPDDARAQKFLLITLLGVGCAFSVRYLMSPSMALFDIGPGDPDLLYLANSPLVAFAAAWLLLYGCFREPKIWRACIIILIAMVPVAAMIGMMQRATLALLALAWLGFYIHAVVRQPRRAIVLGFLAGIICSILSPLPVLIYEALAAKTMNVGWNARGAEWAALFDALNQNALTAIFGTGWGSLLKSPAVGDLWVRFSHSLLTAMLWKTGWIGLLLCLTAIASLVDAARKRLHRDAVTLCALLLPLLPALFLYGSYKSLCFGLLLLGLARLNWTAKAPA